MSRFEAIVILLSALERTNPGEYAVFKHDLLASLGYADVQDAFDDALDVLMRERSGAKLH